MERPPLYVLVASQEQVNAEYARLAELNRRPYANGEPEQAAAVVLTASDEAAVAFTRAVAGINAIRDAEGLPRIQVFDRRTTIPHASQPGRTRPDS